MFFLKLTRFTDTGYLHNVYDVMCSPETTNNWLQASEVLDSKTFLSKFHKPAKFSFLILLKTSKFGLHCPHFSESVWHRNFMGFINRQYVGFSCHLELK